MCTRARVQEILKSVDEIAEDQFGRKVIYYLLAPRDPHHFHPDIINIVAEGDGNPSRFERCLHQQRWRVYYANCILVKVTGLSFRTVLHALCLLQQERCSCTSQRVA